MLAFGQSVRSHFHLWLLLLVTATAALSGRMVLAQEKAAEAATDPAEAENAVAESDSTTENPAPVRQSQLYWVMHTSGWIGGVLLIISIYFVAVVIQLFLEMQEQVVIPPDLVDECEQLLAKRDYNGVYKKTKESTSEFGKLVATGLTAISSGLNESREAIDRLGEALSVEMEKKISMLAVIGSLGPMIGLLGTLKGMIASFSVIATSGTQLKASEVAGGISEALLITFEGVALSVPAIYFYAVFKNRVSTLSVSAINLADEFMRRVHHSTTVKSAPTA